MKSFLILFALLTSAYQDGSYDLLWKPKADQKLVYALKLDGQMMEQLLLMSAEVHLHVKKVEANGDYTLGSKFKGMSMTFGNDKQTLPDEPEENQRFNARGDLIEPSARDAEEDDDAIGELLARAGEYQPPAKPIKVGDSWVHEFPEDKKRQIPKATGKYKLLDAADGKLRIEMSYRENSGKEPTSATGIAIIDRETATLIDIQSEVKNLRFQEGVPPAAMKLSMTLK